MHNTQTALLATVNHVTTRKNTIRWHWLLPTLQPVNSLCLTLTVFHNFYCGFKFTFRHYFSANIIHKYSFSSVLVTVHDKVHDGLMIFSVQYSSLFHTRLGVDFHFSARSWSSIFLPLWQATKMLVAVAPPLWSHQIVGDGTGAQSSNWQHDRGVVFLLRWD